MLCEQGVVEVATVANVRRSHHVYVVLLRQDVWRSERFQLANPGYYSAKPCVYVGMTGLTPEERFRQHRRGRKANTYVMRHGLRLLPELYESLNPMTYDMAVHEECALAERLRAEGFAVWQR